MVVHAHPDDEVFSTGGLLARHAEAGDRVILVYGTRGEEGEMYHPELDPEEAKARLGEIREAEVREAAAGLGVDEIYFLGYRDSGMRDTEPNQNPAAFMNAPLDEAAGRLMAIMRDTKPQVVVTYDENGGYGHPDHIMTNRVTVEAFRRLQGEPGAPRKLYYTTRSSADFRRAVEAMRSGKYPTPHWLKERLNEEIDFDQWGSPEDHITARIDVRPYLSRKKQALATHRTQIKSDFFYLSIPDELMSEFEGTEYFHRVEPPAKPGEREADLFEGIESDEAAA